MSTSHTPSILRLPSADQIKAEHHISLVDHSRAADVSEPSQDAERGGSDTPSASPTPGGAESGNLYKRLSKSNSLHESVRREINRQKLARYGPERFEVGESQAPPPDEDTRNAPQAGQETNAAQRGHLERAQARAWQAIRRKKTLGQGRDEANVVIDLLYENQRGMFLFGVPKYSSSSLLPTDPKPWQNAQFRTSPVDIRNAQLPDPSWEWTWKNWYVDMSRDVDEEGWEYSFAFLGRGARTFAWHGNHPWFHSFVRRRRWLRMRRRRELGVHATHEKSHELTAEYFTIHPKIFRSESLIGSQIRASISGPPQKRTDDAEDVAKMEVTNIADLFRALRAASVDREKLVAIRNFIEQGGDELFYLSERMDDIMGMLIFQTSRRHLLADLIARHEGVHQEERELNTHRHHDDENKQREHDQTARHANNLLRAIHAADAHVKKLEYWSDMKEVSQFAVGIEHDEDNIQPSFWNKQTASEGVQELHKHPEHPAETSPKTPSKESTGSLWFDTKSKRPRKESSDDTDLERYTTAAESASEISGISKRPPRDKGKGKASNLDGVPEEGDDHATVAPLNDGGSHWDPGKPLPRGTEFKSPPETPQPEPEPAVSPERKTSYFPFY